jgi:tRNA-dihydrouridine synthase B
VVAALSQATSPSAFPFSIPTMFAPMEGVTTPILRDEISQLGGVGVVCTEFIRISSEVIRPEHLRKQVIKSKHSALSVQLMGKGSDWMAGAAEVLDEAGADVVDINMGCPTRRAVRGGVGAAMLKDPVLLEDVLSSMREKVTGILSAKIRAGFDNPDQVVMIAQTVQRAGADFIVVHPRCRKDHYKGVADWRIVKHLKENLDIPVIGNGDCWYASDALRLEEMTGCDGVMIGRPVLRNPWIFKQIQDLRTGREVYMPSGEEVFAFFYRVAKGYHQTLPEIRVVGKLKEFSKYLTSSIDDEKKLMKSALRSQSYEDLLKVMEEGLTELPAEAFDLAPRSESPMRRSAADNLEASLSGDISA